LPKNAASYLESASLSAGGIEPRQDATPDVSVTAVQTVSTPWYGFFVVNATVAPTTGLWVMALVSVAAKLLADFVATAPARLVGARFTVSSTADVVLES
jgi:hypothetical protein